MRNYFAIAFTIVYLTLTVGVAKTTHYCMGREKNSSLFSFSTEKCICAVIAKAPMPCCDDRHEILKIDDDHSGSQVLMATLPQFNLIGMTYSDREETLPVREVSFTKADEINPPPPKIPLYQSFCSLVFYDSIV
ncbi:MAG: hypothetical protein HOP08_16610 [Cyclobacteriaceae bacterium]|nr:hypothetical protein [Cyclobacteriaceae bacterium]